MTELAPEGRFRFGVFEADAATGELRRKGVKVKLHAQPFQVLRMFLERPGELLTREEICRGLWPEGTFVDYEHGVNSAVNRIREALGDSAGSPRFIETLARRGYRFVAPVERLVDETIADTPAPAADRRVPVAQTAVAARRMRILASTEELPAASHGLVVTLFVLLQLMYVGFYVGALGNLTEIEGLCSGLPGAALIFDAIVVTAALLIPVRAFVISLVAFRAPAAREKFLRLWWFLPVADWAWALSPFLLLHHINAGVALACTALLVYSPFAQRSLVLMGTGVVHTAAGDV